MCSFQSVLGLLVEGIARGFNTFRMSVVAERANVAPGDRQPAAHETLNAFCAKGCVAALADSSPATEQEHRVMAERELLRAEVITIAPWLTQVQRRALSLQASFPPPERVDCDEVLSSLFRAKLPLHEVMTAMLGPAVAGGITAALCGMGPINVSASIEATLGAVILNVRRLSEVPPPIVRFRRERRRRNAGPTNVKCSGDVTSNAWLSVLAIFQCFVSFFFVHAMRSSWCRALQPFSVSTGIYGIRSALTGRSFLDEDL